MQCAVRIFFNCADGADDRDSDDLRRPVVRRNPLTEALFDYSGVTPPHPIAGTP